MSVNYSLACAGTHATKSSAIAHVPGYIQLEQECEVPLIRRREIRHSYLQFHLNPYREFNTRARNCVRHPAINFIGKIIKEVIGMRYYIPKPMNSLAELKQWTCLVRSVNLHQSDQVIRIFGAFYRIAFDGRLFSLSLSANNKWLDQAQKL